MTTSIEEPVANAASVLTNALRLEEISTLLIREGNVNALSERLLDLVISLMSADMGSMQVSDSARGELFLLAWRGFHPEAAAFWEWVRHDSNSTCGQVLSSGERIIVSDVEACDRLVGTADLDAYRPAAVAVFDSVPIASTSHSAHAAMIAE